MRVRRNELVIRGDAAHNTSMSSEGGESEYVTLYKRAFAGYSVHALWYIQPLENPAPEDALVVARALRTNGDLPARRLAEQIEHACHAAV